MSDKLLVVNHQDEFLRYEEKEKCHQGQGILHRAFSVYIFNNKGELLIQKRSSHKPLWPFFWANSCCSHPRKDESYVKAGERRMEEELGFSCCLWEVDKFEYKAKFLEVGSEHEMCAILAGRYDGKVKLNPKEAIDYKWVDPYKLAEDFKKNSDKYTPWLKIGLGRYLKIKETEKKEKEKLEIYLKDIVEKVDPIIKILLELYINKKFYKLIDYQAFTGGKRLRPALTIACGKLLGGKMKDIVYPAAGLEVLHNSTLIVDDIIDHSELRRNKPTLWSKYGKSMAECLGLDYLAVAFEGANRSKKPKETSELFANTLKVIMEGEMMDVLFEQNGREAEAYVTKNRYHKIDKKEYYEMVGKKTAILFQSCCETGGINSEGSKKEIELLKDYGYNFGMAFQIRDDILDIFGDEKLGKKIGGDIKERKLGNIVLLLAMKELSEKENQKILTIFNKKSMVRDNIEEIINLIKKTNSHEQADCLAQGFAEKAKESLKKLPNNKWNKLLEDLVTLSVHRNK